MSIVINTEGLKEVRFDIWCKSCRHYDTPMFADEKTYNIHCCDCLDEPTNQYSTKPVKWEEKE